MQRGIVVEIQAQHWVVMTPDGSFLKVPSQNPHVRTGEEVLVQSATEGPKLNWMVYLSGAVAALLAFFFLFPFFSGNQAQAQSYVYVEMQPGVEIALNQADEVVNLRPIHARAAEIIDQIDWKQQSVDDVVIRYLTKAKSHGFIRKEDPLILSAVDKNGAAKKTLSSIRTKIEKDAQIGKQQLGLNIFTLSMPQIVQKEAQKSGLTPGKYGVWLLSKQSGKEIPFSEIAKKPIDDWTEELSSVSTLLDNPPSEQEWSDLVKGENDNLPNHSTQEQPIDKTKTQDQNQTTPKDKDQTKTQDNDSTQPSEQNPPDTKGTKGENPPESSTGETSNDQSTQGNKSDSLNPDHTETQKTTIP